MKILDAQSIDAVGRAKAKVLCEKYGISFAQTTKITYDESKIRFTILTNLPWFLSGPCNEAESTELELDIIGD